MIRVVLDTNVIVSALLDDDSLPAYALELVIQGEVMGASSEAMLAELEAVLRRPKLGIEPRKIGSFLAHFGIGRPVGTGLNRRARQGPEPGRERPLPVPGAPGRRARAGRPQGLSRRSTGSPAVLGR